MHFLIFFQIYKQQKSNRKIHIKNRNSRKLDNNQKMKIFESFLVFLSSTLLNNQGPTYTVISKDHHFQIRNYDSWIVAETVVQSTHEDAGNEAFHILAGYIFGKNDRNVKIDMTSPVTEFEVASGQYAVQFFMPAKWTLDTLPKPNDSRVTLKTIPARKLAVLRYNGGWSQGLYSRELKDLKTEVDHHGLVIKNVNQPIWARYNSPMAPSPIRTNQVMFEVEA